MSLLGDMNFIDEFWVQLESPMFSMVNPNEICPTEVLSVNHNTIPDASIQNTPNINYNFNQNISSDKNHATINQLNTQFTSYPMLNSKEVVAPKQEILHNKQRVLQSQAPDNQYQYHALIEPPPVLSLCEDPKLQIQQQLELHRALSQQRREKLKARLEKQPPQLPPLMRRKMSGRERQLELERQEAQQLKLKEHYLELINQLERKCNKLREILESIVTTSPEYNAQMIHFLESSELLFDQNEAETSRQT